MRFHLSAPHVLFIHVRGFIRAGVDSCVFLMGRTTREEAAEKQWYLLTVLQFIVWQYQRPRLHGTAEGSQREHCGFHSWNNRHINSQTEETEYTIKLFLKKLDHNSLLFSRNCDFLTWNSYTQRPESKQSSTDPQPIRREDSEGWRSPHSQWSPWLVDFICGQFSLASKALGLS